MNVGATVKVTAYREKHNFKCQVIGCCDQLGMGYHQAASGLEVLAARLGGENLRYLAYHEQICAPKAGRCWLGSRQISSCDCDWRLPSAGLDAGLDVLDAGLDVLRVGQGNSGLTVTVTVMEAPRCQEVMGASVIDIRPTLSYQR